MRIKGLYLSRGERGVSGTVAAHLTIETGICSAVGLSAEAAHRQGKRGAVAAWDWCSNDIRGSVQDCSVVVERYDL